MQSEPGVPSREGTVPLSVPEIGGNEWKYIKECLDTNWVSSAGSYVDRFEVMLAKYSGSKYGVATVSGTAAIHIALLVAGVKADDEVLVSDLTFIAPANAVRYIGAWPVFIDAEPDYWQIDPQKVIDFLDNECRMVDGQLVNKTTGRRIAAVLPVHILGHPCDMDPILEAARKYGLTVVEDATESLGSTYKGRMSGNMGDLACFSFNGNKLITTGGGGMIVTNNQVSAQKARYLTTQAKDDPVEYIHGEIGFNYRLSNIQAAMGVAQMEQIGDFVSKKRAIARAYEKAFNSVDGITTMAAQPDTEPVYWLYTILLPEPTTLENRKRVIRELNESGIGARPLWHPIHSQGPYKECQAYEIDHTERLYQRGISLPSSVGLTDAEQERTIAAVKAAMVSLTSKIYNLN